MASKSRKGAKGRQGAASAKGRKTSGAEVDPALRSSAYDLEGVMRSLHWYTGQYRLMMMICVVSLAIGVMSVLGNVWLMTHPTEPLIIAQSPDGRITPLVPLDKPLVSDATVLSWSTETVTRTLSIDFAHWRADLNDVADRFTDSGFDEYLAALNASGNLEAIKERRIVVSAVPSEAPVIVAKGLLGGTYVWKVKVPVVVTYNAARSNQTREMVVNLTVVRISRAVNPQGLAVTQFITGP